MQATPSSQGRLAQWLQRIHKKVTENNAFDLPKSLDPYPLTLAFTMHWDFWRTSFIVCRPLWSVQECYDISKVRDVVARAPSMLVCCVHSPLARIETVKEDSALCPDPHTPPHALLVPYTCDIGLPPEGITAIQSPFDPRRTITLSLFAQHRRSLLSLLPEADFLGVSSPFLYYKPSSLSGTLGFPLHQEPLFVPSFNTCITGMCTLLGGTAVS